MNTTPPEKEKGSSTKRYNKPQNQRRQTESSPETKKNSPNRANTEPANQGNRDKIEKPEHVSTNLENKTTQSINQPVKSTRFNETKNTTKAGNQSNCRPPQRRQKPTEIMEKENASENEVRQPLTIYGRNAVREALKSDRSVDKILVCSEEGSIKEILGMARDKNIIIQKTDKSKLDVFTLPFGYDGRPANHQGIVALMPEVDYVTIEDIIKKARQKGERPFILVLDSLNDPHNLGAILRTAECAGVHGVIIPKHRSVSVTAAATKASAGAALHIPVARVTNLNQAVRKLKDNGVWIVGAEADAPSMKTARMDGSIALVLGSEGEGISRALKEQCDLLVSIPMYGKINSLNVSNAAAILMYEKLNQDRK